MAILIAVSHRWDEKYANAALSERPPEALVVQVAETRTPGRALDLACGLGRNALYLAAQGWQVTAVDYSLSLSTSLANAPPKVCLCTSCTPILKKDEYSIAPNAWDLIIDCCYLQRSLFTAIKAGVRQGGAFVGVFPMSGINPAYLMRAGEGRELFGDWKFLQYTESERTEIMAEKP